LEVTVTGRRIRLIEDRLAPEDHTKRKPPAKPEPKMRPIGARQVDHMLLAEWVRCCEDGGFIDYDGFGHLATASEESDISIRPSQRRELPILNKDGRFTHIVWYNK
jgi:hypothetical protein